jgi:hypothetical protein
MTSKLVDQRHGHIRSLDPFLVLNVFPRTVEAFIRYRIGWVLVAYFVQKGMRQMLGLQWQ